MAIVIQTLSDSAQARKDLSQLRESVQGIQGAAQSLTTKMYSFGKALAFGGALYGAISGFMHLSDTMTQVTNRVSVFTKSQVEAKNALYMVGKIALDTHSRLEGVSSLYSKFQLNSSALGMSQQQVAIATKAVAQSIQVSGANAEETNSVMLQLGQTLAKNVLNGDEFNSIMENGPYTAAMIAKGMGVTVQQLLKMKNAGQLFTKDVLRGILHASDEINAKAKTMQVTFGQAFTNMGTSLTLLFGAVSKAFLGSSGGGLAEVINGWAQAIGEFAQSFGYYLVMAEAKAFNFVASTMIFFQGLWDAISSGPEGIVKAFGMVVEAVKPYAIALYGTLMSYANAVYDGSSGMFFSFLAWLKQSSMTAGVADAIGRANQYILTNFRKFRDLLSQIDYGSFFKGAIDGVRAGIMKLKDINLGQYIGTLFNSLKNIDVNKFIPNLSVALDTIKSWAQAAAHWFWWLYDVTIGHSYIPDLVEGIISWIGKLTGAPLSFVKKFVTVAAGLFASINPFGSLNAGLGLLKKFAIVAGLAGAGYGAFSLLKGDGLESVMDIFTKGTGVLSDAVDKFVKAPLSKVGVTVKNAAVDTVDDGREGANKVLAAGNKFFNGNMKVREQDPMSGQVAIKNYTRFMLADKLHIPRDKQAPLAAGITALVVGGLMLAMKSGTTRSVVISLFTTAALASSARFIDERLWHELFIKLASFAVNMIDKGFRLLMGGPISKDPFGFLLLIAKFSLLFKAGREYFAKMAMGIATAPGKAGQAVANRVGYAGQVVSARIAEGGANRVVSRLDTALETSKLRFEVALDKLANAMNAAGAPMGKNAAKLALASGQLPAGYTDPAHNDALKNVQNERTAVIAAQGNRDRTGGAALAGAKKVRDIADATAKKFSDQGAAIRGGLMNFGTLVGGAVGTGVGMQVGNMALERAQTDRNAKGAQALQANDQVTIKGKRLTSDQAKDVVSGKIEIGNLDKAGQEFAKTVVASLPVPMLKQVFYQFGGMAIGQGLGSMLGALAGQFIGFLFLGLPGMILKSIMSTKLAQTALEGAKALAYWIAFRAQYYGFLAIQRVGAIAAGAATAAAAGVGFLASAVITGVTMAATFIAGLVGWPVLIAAALIAAVIGVGYLIVSNWATITAVGQAFVDSIKAMFTWVGSVFTSIVDKISAAIKDPIGFFEKLPDKFLGIIDKIRSVLPTWLGGTAPDKAKPTVPDKATATDPTTKAVSASRATGGEVRGPGTGTSDSVLARLSNGEFVINAASYSANRGLVEAINGGKPLPAFAKGGRADGRVSGNLNNDGTVISDMEMSPVEYEDPLDKLTYAQKLARLKDRSLQWAYSDADDALRETARPMPGILDSAFGALDSVVNYFTKAKLKPGVSAIKDPAWQAQMNTIDAINKRPDVVAAKKLYTSDFENLQEKELEFHARTKEAKYASMQQYKYSWLDNVHGDFVTLPQVPYFKLALAHQNAYVQLLKSLMPKALPGKKGLPNYDPNIKVEDQRNGNIPKKTVSVADRIGDWMFGTKRDENGDIIQSHATGGPISGPGTGKSDDVLAWLSNGEYVVNAASTARHKDLLEAINGGQPLPAFADGGMAIQHQIDRNMGGVKTHTRASKAKTKAKVDYKAPDAVNISVGVDVNPIDVRIAQLQATRAETAANTAKVSSGVMKWAGGRIIANIDKQIADMQDLRNFSAVAQTSALSGANPKADDKTKGPKTTTTETDPDIKFSDELDIINEMFPKLRLTMKEYLKMAASTRAEILNSIVPIKRKLKGANDVAANTPGVAEFVADQQSKIATMTPDITSKVNAGRNSYDAMAGSLEPMGLNITKEEYQMLTPDTVKQVQDYLTKMEAWAKQLEDNPINSREIRTSMTNATADLTSAINENQSIYRSVYARVTALASETGDQVDKSAFNRLSSKAQAQIVGIMQNIKNLQEQIDGGLDEQGRQAAQQKIDANHKILGRLLDKPEDKAKQAGEDFTNTMKSSFSEGISKFIKTGKFNLMDIASTFTNKIIDGFTGSLTDKLFGQGSKMGGIFDLIGGSTAKAGGGLGGLLDKGKSVSDIASTYTPDVAGLLDPKSIDMNSDKIPVSGMLSQMTSMAAPANDKASGGGLFGGLGKLFGGKKKDSPGGAIASVLTSKAPDIGGDIANPLLKIAPDMGKTMGDSLKSVTSAGGGGGGGMIGAAATAGSLLGMLIGNLFADGGHVKGPGTSTSDSIPAMLSNGEFVVKAKQVGKHRGLLTAINNDQVPKYADGGLVGAGVDIGMATQAIDKSMPTTDNSKTSQTINIPITGDISRQTKRTIFEMIPEITRGVNAHNREKGIR